MPQVPVLNERINLQKAEANLLWDNGVRVPRSRRRSYLHDRVRRSEDGDWIVKRFRPQTGLSAQKAAETGIREFDRMQELGLNVVSFAMVPVAPKEIVIVSPWIDEMRRSRKSERQQQVLPVLYEYFGALAAGTKPYRPYLTGEIAQPEQYSTLTPTEEVFLHDVEPYIHVSGTPVIAKNVLLGLK